MSSDPIALRIADGLFPHREEDELVAYVPVDMEDGLVLLRCLAGQLQFPGYFGHNWNALWDCLCDFSWTTKRKIFIVHEGLPVGLSEEELRIYLDILNRAVADWKSERSVQHACEWGQLLHELEVTFPEECHAEIERLLQAKTLLEGDCRDARGDNHLSPAELVSPRTGGVVDIGDVVEITTPNGFAYAQLTHDHPEHGAVLRILPGLYESRPADLAALVRQRERYVTRYALHYALRLILMDDEFDEAPKLAIVNEMFPVPERNRRFPLFRSPKAPDPVTGEISSWFLWDGRGHTMAREIEQLTAEHLDLPLGVIPDHRQFIEQIVSGWSPRDDTRWK